MDPLVVSAGQVILGAATRGRQRQKTNASNVLVVVSSDPNDDVGYRLTPSVINRSSGGISNVAVRLQLRGGGFLEWRGRRHEIVTAFADQAVAAGDDLTLTIPHVARLSEPSFGVDRYVRAFIATLFWRDDQGVVWRRTDGEPPKRCSVKEFPRRPTR